MADESLAPLNQLENVLGVSSAEVVELLQVFLALAVDLLRLSADLPGRVELLDVGWAHPLVSPFRQVDPLDGDLDHLCPLMGALRGRLDVDGEVAAPSQHFLLLPRCLHRLLQSLYFF